MYWRHTISCGLTGVPLSEIASAKLVYPENGPTGPYYHRHADPVIPVWWTVDELAPLAAKAIARCQMGPSQAPAHS